MKRHFQDFLTNYRQESRPSSSSFFVFVSMGTAALFATTVTNKLRGHSSGTWARQQSSWPFEASALQYFSEDYRRCFSLSFYSYPFTGHSAWRTRAASMTSTVSSAHAIYQNGNLVSRCVFFSVRADLSLRGREPGHGRAPRAVLHRVPEAAPDRAGTRARRRHHRRNLPLRIRLSART